MRRAGQNLNGGCCRSRRRHVGITSELEGEETGRVDPGFRGGDRTTLDLPQEQQDMLETIKASGKPLVVVLMNGSALSVNWAAQNAARHP